MFGEYAPSRSSNVKFQIEGGFSTLARSRWRQFPLFIHVCADAGIAIMSVTAAAAHAASVRDRALIAWSPRRGPHLGGAGASCRRGPAAPRRSPEGRGGKS